MMNSTRRHVRVLVACLLALIAVSFGACGGNTELDASRGYDPTPTPTTVPAGGSININDPAGGEISIR